MNDREAFKFGFLSRCLDRGLTTPAEMLGAVKLAAEALEKKAGWLTPWGEGAHALGKTVGEIGSTALSWGVPLALAAPPVLGAVAGGLAAKAQDTDDFDTDDAKRQELVDTYGREAAKLRRQGLVRRHAASLPRAGGRPLF